MSTQWTFPHLAQTMRGKLYCTLHLKSQLTHLSSKPADYAPIDESFNPVIHRINQAIRQHAVHPDEPIKPAAGILLRFSGPPDELVERAKPKIDALVSASDVKKGKKKYSDLASQRQCLHICSTSEDQGQEEARDRQTDLGPRCRRSAWAEEGWQDHTRELDP